MAEVNPEPLPAGRRYGRQSVDERTAERRAVLLDAAFVLIAGSGWKSLRIDALCREAGLNKRYFYESFTNLDAVVAELVDRVAEEAISVALGAISTGASPTEATRQAVGTFVRHLTDDPRRARVLFGALPAGDAAAGHRTEAVRRIVSAAALTGRGIHELPAHEGDPVIDITAAMLVGGTSHAVLDWLEGQISCSQDQLVEDIVLLWQVAGDAAVARLGVPDQP